MISYTKNDNGTYNIGARKNAESVFQETNVKSDRLEDYVGKEVSQKILNNEGVEGDRYDHTGKKPKKMMELSGVDLKVGGKGMKGFYGSPTEGSLGIVGNVAKSLFKQEPKTVEIEGERKQYADYHPTAEEAKQGKKLSDNEKSMYLHTPFSGEFAYTIENGKAKRLTGDDINNEKGDVYIVNVGKSKSTQHSIDITPELKTSVEGGQPLFKTDESKTEFGGFQTRDGKPIGYTYDTDQVARERFDISKLKKIGSGSDRDVYDLGNGKVLKVAKTARGLTQNIYEGDHYLTSVVPEVTERGLNYVVAENTPRIKTSDVVETFDWDGNVTGKATAGEMLKELQKLSQRDMNNHDSKLQDVLAKYGLQDIMSYEVLWNDFIAQRNWGYKDGKAYHSDGGTFGGVDMIDSHKGKTNLSDPEFRKIYEESKRLKKQFGDTDKATMYSKEGGQIEAQYRIENGKNIVEAIKDFDGSPRATVALTHEIMHPTVVAIIDGAKKGNEVGAKHTKTIVDEFNKANPNSKVTIEDLIKGNDAFKDGTTSKQYRAVQEFIADSWEKYHTEGGKGFSADFQKVLDQITQAFKAVYKSLTGKELTPELRQMFDEILGKEAVEDLLTNTNNNGKNEVREIENGQRLPENEGGQQKRKGNGQEADVQKEVTPPVVEKTTTDTTKPVSKESVSPIEKIKADSENIYKMKQEIKNKPLTDKEQREQLAKIDKLVAKEYKELAKTNKLMEELETKGLLRTFKCK